MNTDITTKCSMAATDELMENIQPMLISNPPAQPARKKRTPSARKPKASATNEAPADAAAPTPTPGSGPAATRGNARNSDTKKKPQAKKAKPTGKNNTSQVTKATPLVIAVSVDSDGNYDAQSQDESPTPSLMARIMDHDSITPFDVAPVQRARTSLDEKLQQLDTWTPAHGKNMGDMRGPVEQWLMHTTEVDGLMEQLVVQDSRLSRPGYVSPYPPLASISSSIATADDGVWSASQMQLEKRAAAKKAKADRRARRAARRLKRDQAAAAGGATEGETAEEAEKKTRRNLTAGAAKTDGGGGAGKKAAATALGIKRSWGGRADVEDTLEERDGNVYLRRAVKVRKTCGE